MWGDVISAAKALGGWVQLNRDNKRVQREELIDTLSELHHAANLTRAFSAEVRVRGHKGTHRQREDSDLSEYQWKVSEAWRSVGQKIARLSNDDRIQEVCRDLYERCFDKARYWADPEEYQSRDVDIELTRLVDDVALTIENARRGIYR